MTPLALTLLYASRYADGRGTGCYEDVIAAAHSAWPLLDARSREQLLTAWREEIRANRAEWERCWAELERISDEQLVEDYIRERAPARQTRAMR